MRSLIGCLVALALALFDEEAKHLRVKQNVGSKCLNVSSRTNMGSHSNALLRETDKRSNMLVQHDVG